jgi:endonuclease III
MDFNIELYKNKAEFILQTAQQIIKDFGLFGLEITFSGNTDMAYEELFNQLNSTIRYLIENDFGRLYALLYQIDLSESQIISKKREYPGHSDSEIITELVIHRELKKVLTRNYFKMKKGTQSTES